MRRALRAAAVVAVGTVAAARPAAADQVEPAAKNVVVVHQFDPALPVSSRLLQGIESVLDQQAGVDVHSEHLDLSRSDGTSKAEDLARWYASKYAGKRVDVVVAAGEDAPGISEGTPARLAFDARELERWGIPESWLPAGGAVAFESPPPWDSRPRTVALLGATLLVQAGLIVALLLQRRSRRRLEAEARDSRARIAHMNRVSVVGELAGTLAHEVNTPLAAMMNDARAARRFLDAPTPRLADARDAITAVETHGQRARDVLLHVRSALRKDGQPPQVVELSDVVSEAIDLVASDAREHDIRVELPMPATGLRVECDAIQIQQVALNLLLNALEAAQGQPPERRRIRVEVSARPDCAEVAVRDWGRGVPLDDRAQLFQPFFTTKRDGLGMGLSISRTIIEAHGGRITMEPGTPVGTTFRFSLPLAIEQPAAAEAS